jgi:hypothetical protein
MKIKSSVMAVLILAVIFGGISIASALDLWSTTSNKTPARFKDGAYVGQYNPEDIRGSYTLADVARLFEIDEQILLSAFGLPANTDPSLFRTSALEEVYASTGADIGNGSVQLFVALYKNLPITLDGTALPQSAVDVILAANPNLTAEQISYLTDHTVNMTPEENPSDTSQTIETSHEETENLINGQTTFQQLLDKGLTRDQIESVLGTKMPPTNQTVKDFCLNEGLPFSTVKAKLTELMQP